MSSLCLNCPEVTRFGVVMQVILGLPMYFFHLYTLKTASAWERLPALMELRLSNWRNLPCSPQSWRLCMNGEFGSFAPFLHGFGGVP